MIWERVHTINEWWDGPVLGVADVFGSPHIYKLPFDDAKNDYSDYYLVSPIDPELLALALEDWDIWMRWRAAFDRGAVSVDTHPALPIDRARHEQITLSIGARLTVDLTRCRKLKADFRAGNPAGESIVDRWLEVCWIEHEDA